MARASIGSFCSASTRGLLSSMGQSITLGWAPFSACQLESQGRALRRKLSVKSASDDSSLQNIFK